MNRIAALLALCLVTACDAVPDMPLVVAPIPGTGLMFIGGTTGPALVARQPVRGPVPDAAFDTALNAYRAAAGKVAVTPNARLTAAAQAHAADMVANGYLSHTSQDGRSYLDRIAAQGYQSCYPVENLAAGQAGSLQALAEWEGSSGHDRNLLVDGPAEYGFGRVGEVYVLILARLC